MILRANCRRLAVIVELMDEEELGGSEMEV